MIHGFLYLTFSHGVMYSRFTYVIVYISILFFFNGWILFHYMDIPHFVYCFISWWTSEFFHNLTMINNAVMRINAHIFVWTYVFNFLGVELLGSCGNPEFNFLRNCQTIFHSLVICNYFGLLQWVAITFLSLSRPVSPVRGHIHIINLVIWCTENTPASFLECVCQECMTLV